MIVRMRHVRMAGMCGGKAVRDHVIKCGLSWHDFLRHGLPIEVLRAVDDALVQQVVEAAERDYKVSDERQ